VKGSGVIRALCENPDDLGVTTGVKGCACDDHPKKKKRDKAGTGKGEEDAPGT
jgi:hypothetical protein